MIVLGVTTANHIFTSHSGHRWTLRKACQRTGNQRNVSLGSLVRWASAAAPQHLLRQAILKASEHDLLEPLGDVAELCKRLWGCRVVESILQGLKFPCTGIQFFKYSYREWITAQSIQCRRIFTTRYLTSCFTFRYEGPESRMRQSEVANLWNKTSQCSCFA